MHNKEVKKVANFSRNMINIYKNPARYRKLIERAVLLLKQAMNAKGITDSNELAKWRHSLDVRKIERTLANEFEIDKGDLDFIGNEVWGIIDDNKSIDDVLGTEQAKVKEEGVYKSTPEGSSSSTEAPGKPNVEEVDGTKLIHTLRALKLVPDRWKDSTNKKKVVEYFKTNLNNLIKLLSVYKRASKKSNSTIRIKIAKKIALYDEGMGFDYKNIEVYVDQIYNIINEQGVSMENIEAINKRVKELSFYLNSMSEDLDLDYEKGELTKAEVKDEMSRITKIFVKDPEGAKEELDKFIAETGRPSKDVRKQLEKDRIPYPEDLFKFND